MRTPALPSPAGGEAGFRRSRAPQPAAFARCRQDRPIELSVAEAFIDTLDGAELPNGSQDDRRHRLVAACCPRRVADRCSVLLPLGQPTTVHGAQRRDSNALSVGSIVMIVAPFPLVMIPANPPEVSESRAK